MTTENEATQKERRPLEVVEEEASRLVQKLAGAAGWSQDEVKRQVREVAERFASQRRELERTVEERVRSVMGGLRLPRREDLNGLNRRMDALAERLSKLGAK